MKKAFTLIEILVALFLLTLLLGLAMSALKLYLRNFNDLKVSLPLKVINYEILDKNLKAIYPYPINNNKQYFFKQNQNSIKYISLYGFYFDNGVVSQLKCENNKLIYLESPLYNKYQNYLNPKILENIVYKRVLFKAKNICKIKVSKKDSMPDFIEIDIDNYKYFFKPEINWFKLKDILNIMEQNI